MWTIFLEKTMNNRKRGTDKKKEEEKKKRLTDSINNVIFDANV